MAESHVRAIIEAEDRASAALGVAGGSFSSLTTKMTLAAGSATAWALAAGNAADKARQTIVDGTGASGAALDSLIVSYENVAGIAGVSLADTSAAVADLNTHMGLTGPGLERVAEAALKAGVDTNLFGSAVANAGFSAEESVTLLDQLTAVSQNTGVGINQLIGTVQKQGARFAAAGVETEELIAIVAEAADAFGPGGMRGAMSELAEEADKGVIPAIRSLGEQVGNVDGLVEQTHGNRITFLEQLGSWKDAATVWVGESGNLIGSIGSIGTALIPLVPMLPALGSGFRLLWAAITGPVGLVVAAVTAVGAAVYAFRGQIGDVLSSIIPVVADFASSLIEKFRGVAEFADEWIGTDFVASLNSARAAVEDTGRDLADWTDSWGEVPPAVEATTFSLDEVTGAAGDTAGALGSGREGLIGVLRGTEDAAKETAAGVKVLASGISALDDRLEDLQKTTRNTINALIGSQGLSGAFQQAAAGATLASTQIGSGMLAAAPHVEGVTDRIGLIGDEFDVVEAAGTVWLGHMQSIAGSVGGAFAQVVHTVSNIGNALAAGDWIGAAIGTATAVWNWAKNLGGPSEAELAGREAFESFRTGAQVPLAQLGEYNRQVADAVAQGWDQSLAEVRARFVTMGTAAGLSHDQAFDAYSRYQQAVKDGNTDLMQQLEDQYGEWVRTVEGAASQAADAVDGSTSAIVYSAEEIGNQFKGLTEQEAEKLGAELERLGTRANRGFTVLHSAALATGNALANVTLPAVQGVRDALAEAARGAERLGGALVALPVPGGGPAVETRAAGGPVAAGRPYLVGERGPELFVPRQSGSISAGGGGGGARVVIENINIRSSDPEAVIDELKRALREEGVGLPA